MVQRLLFSIVILIAVYTQSIFAKQPGSTYCFNNICHRVLTVKEAEARVGKDEKVKASFYDDCMVDRDNPCSKTSSGEQFRPDRADNAASPIYPNGTRVLVTNPRNGRVLVVRINNSGPYHRSRLLDISRAAAERLGFIADGVADLMVRPLSVSDTDRAAQH